MTEIKKQKVFVTRYELEKKKLPWLVLDKNWLTTPLKRTQSNAWKRRRQETPPSKKYTDKKERSFKSSPTILSVYIYYQQVGQFISYLKQAPHVHAATTELGWISNALLYVTEKAKFTTRLDICS